ncbi:hypothetical protein [Dehalobacterium formicoaceticum]|nr:hypothetical protein [Dehalobacterium formicoaceticum]
MALLKVKMSVENYLLLMAKCRVDISIEDDDAADGQSMSAPGNL